MEAYAATSRRPVVFARESAAALLGIPIVGGWPGIPRIAVGESPPRRTRVASSVQWVPVPAADVVAAGGMLATSPARTALDVAADRDLPSRVAAIDHVVRTQGVTLSELRDRVDAERPFRGVRKVDAALALATGLAESPLESLSLVRIRQLGFDAPQQQVSIAVDGIRYRVDFVWPRTESRPRIIGEADGRMKYRDHADEVFWQEKRREDDLRSTTERFVRWGWADAWGGTGLARKLQRAGLRADPRIASQFAFRT